MALSLITPPATEPLTLAEANAQLRIDGQSGDQALVWRLIRSARERAEVATQRALITQVWDLVLDQFPCDSWIEIPRPPLVSVSYVHYVDMAGATQTWAASNYIVEAPAGPRCRRGRLSLKFAGIWPITLPQAASVTIRFSAGYGTAAQVPSLLKTAMLMDLATLYEQREAEAIERGAAIEIRSGPKAMYWSYRSHPRQKVAA